MKAKSKSGGVGVLWASWGFALLVACRAPQLPLDQPQLTEPTTSLIAGESVEGRPIEYSVFGAGELTVLLMASIHGDEACGTPLLDRLCDELSRGESPELLVDRRLVIVARANPDGLAANARHNANGVDLNRNFPAKNFRSRYTHGDEALSEPESRALYDLIQLYEPDRIVSFHMAADMLDYDGPGLALATAVAAVSPLEVARMGSRPGSLGSYFGVDLGRPILTVEQPASARRDSDEEAWRTWGPLIRAAILFED
jgi:murein peptide amidase A